MKDAPSSGASGDRSYRWNTIKGGRYAVPEIQELIARSAQVITPPSLANPLADPKPPSINP
jgi:hypothetical protein